MASTPLYRWKLSSRTYAFVYIFLSVLMFDCLSICPYVIAYEKKKVNFLFFGFIYFITSFARNFCELFYWMCNWIPRRGVQVMQTCISFKFREYQAYHPLPTKQGLKVIVSEHSHLAAKIVALCEVTKLQVQNLGWGQGILYEMIRQID